MVDSLLIFNSLNWKRIELMELPIGFEKLSNQISKNKKPLGIVISNGIGLKSTKIEISDEKSLMKEDEEFFTLENSNLKIKISKSTGNIISILKKFDNQEMLEKEGNIYVLYDDTPRDHDAWDVYDYYLQKKEILKLNSIEIKESGPLLKFEFIFC